MFQLTYFGGLLSNFLSDFRSHVSFSWSRVLSRGIWKRFSSFWPVIIPDLQTHRTMPCRMTMHSSPKLVFFHRPACHDATMQQCHYATMPRCHDAMSPSSRVDCTENLHSTRFNVDSWIQSNEHFIWEGLTSGSEEKTLFGDDQTLFQDIQTYSYQNMLKHTFSPAVEAVEQWEFWKVQCTEKFALGED